MNVVRQTILKINLPSLVSVNPSRAVAAWNKDWMPGPYPVTPAQRAAAAKKYNLLPEEYEPDPDGFGDYPKLPDISGSTKDPWQDWDFPSLKKDFHEPMHVLANTISEDRFDINHVEKQQLHPAKQLLMYLSVLLIFFLPSWYLDGKFMVSLPHMKQHLPADGVHYKYPK